jgi:hypothetical protein
MEDPNYEQTDIFAFMMEKPAGKKQRVRTKKAALSSEQKSVKAAISEEASLFGEEMTAGKKPARGKKASPKKAASSAKALPQPKAAAKKEAEGKVSEPGKGSWREKLWEFDITHPSQEIKDTMKEALLTEGFMKREANQVFKGLFFKEKIFNTKNQALEFLENVPTSYAVKYKIGIEPSPKMISLAKRLREKEERLAAYEEAQNEKKFAGDFITCPHCHSRVNALFVKPPLCPVCGDDMRSDTAVKTIRALEEAVAELRKRLEDTARKYNSKFTGGEKWIIRLVNPFWEEKC